MKVRKSSEYVFLSHFSWETRISRTNSFFSQWIACKTVKNGAIPTLGRCARVYFARARILHTTRSSSAHKNSLPQVQITNFHSYVERVLSDLYSACGNTNFRRVFVDVSNKQLLCQVPLKQPPWPGLQNETLLDPGEWRAKKSIFRPISDLSVATTIFQIFLTPDSWSATSIYPRKVVWQSQAENFVIECHLKVTGKKIVS